MLKHGVEIGMGLKQHRAAIAEVTAHRPGPVEQVLHIERCQSHGAPRLPRYGLLDRSAQAAQNRPQDEEPANYAPDTRATLAYWRDD
ncbi:hypothetical protein GCM10009841_23160 [Microlunatus panaciterrae]